MWLIGDAIMREDGGQGDVKVRTFNLKWEGNRVTPIQSWLETLLL